jgi:hypothetical protein
MLSLITGDAMPYKYLRVRELENADKAGDGNCVALVQHYTGIGQTVTWRQGERVMDMQTIPEGTVIATFDRNGRYPNNAHGNHAALFLRFGPRNAKTGKPTHILVMDQWKTKNKISSRPIYPRAQRKADGGLYHDSDNAEAFYIVK